MLTGRGGAEGPVRLDGDGNSVVLIVPVVRMKDQNGKVTVFQTTGKDKRLTEQQIAGMPKRRMDFHSRPTHGSCP